MAQRLSQMITSPSCQFCVQVKFGFAVAWAQSRVEAEQKRFAAIAGEDPDDIYPRWLIPTLRAKGILGEDETL